MPLSAKLKSGFTLAVALLLVSCDQSPRLTPVEQFYQALKSGKQRRIVDALWKLKRQKTVPEELISELEPLLYGEDPTGERKIATQLLLENSNGQSAIEALIQYRSSLHQQGRRHWVTRSLCRMGASDKAGPLLIDEFQSADPQIMFGAGLMLATATQMHDRFEPLLLERLNRKSDKNTIKDLLSISVRSNFRSPELRQLARRYMYDESQTHMIRNLAQNLVYAGGGQDEKRESCEVLRDQLLEMLRIDPVEHCYYWRNGCPEQSIDSALRDLRSTDPEIQDGALWVVYQYGPKAARALPQLIELLDTYDRFDGFADIVDHIRMIGPAGAPWIQELVNYADGLKSVKKRRLLLEAIATIDPDAMVKSGRKRLPIRQVLRLKPRQLGTAEARSWPRNYVERYLKELIRKGEGCSVCRESYEAVMREVLQHPEFASYATAAQKEFRKVAPTCRDDFEPSRFGNMHCRPGEV